MGNVVITGKHLPLVVVVVVVVSVSWLVTVNRLVCQNDFLDFVVEEISLASESPSVSLLDLQPAYTKGRK